MFKTKQMRIKFEKARIGSPVTFTEESLIK